jgi:hypothetical protein
MLLVAIAGFGFLTDLSRVLARADPIRAADLGVSDGRTIAAAARQRVFQSPDKENRATASGLAREALRRDPTATDALEALALIAQLENDRARVDRLLGYSLTLSRRQVRSHFWAIEEAVSRGDIALALDRYDLVLRVSEAAQINLFPVLAAATREPLVRRKLVAVLARRPEWGGRFLTHVAENSTSAPAAGALFAEARARGVPIDRSQWTTLVTGLVAAGRHYEAWDTYRLLDPTAARNRARDPRFTREPATPFEWTVLDKEGVSAAVLAQPEGGRLEVAVSSGTRATVLSQLQLLPSGTYRLSGDGELLEGDALSKTYWVVVCAGGRELARAAPRMGRQSEVTFGADLTVPSDCPVQELRLEAGAEMGSDNLALAFSSVRLEPVVKSGG